MLSKSGSVSINVRVLLFTGLLIANTSVCADEYHYNNILIGDRAAGLGGAYTAIADDPAGLYYNPAGIVYAVGSNISGSMNALHTTKTTYKNALGGKYDWERTSSVLFPNFFGVFQPFGKGKIGLSYAVIDSIQEDQDQSFNDVTNSVSQFNINFNNLDATYNIGPSYAIELNDKLALGITLYAHVRSQQRTINEITYINGNTDVEWLNQYYYTDETGIRPIIGLMWTPMEKWSAGFTFSWTYILRSSANAQNTCQGSTTTTYTSEDFCQSGVLTRNTSDSDSKRQHPLKYSLGVAYFPTDRLLFSGDLNYYQSKEDSRINVLNFATGMEYYLNNDWALRGGLYSNAANTPELSSNNSGRLQPEHVDMFGFSTSISHFSRNSVLSLGINYAFGDGTAQLFTGNTTLQDVSISTVTLFLSATYSY